MPSYRETMTAAIGLMKDGPIKARATRIIDLDREFEIEAGKIAGNRDLSAEGKVKTARSFVTKTAHEFLRSRKLAEISAAKLVENRAKIQLPASDKADTSGAIMRGEMRTHMRSMSAGERKAFLATASLPYLLAAIEAPNELTGINNEVRESVRNRAIEITNPGKLDELHREQEAIRLLDNATRALSETARSFADLPNSQALNRFISEAVPDQRAIDAEIARQVEAI